MSIFRFFSPKLVVAALKRISKLDLAWNIFLVFSKAADHPGSPELHKSLDLLQAVNGKIGHIFTEVSFEFVTWMVFEFFQPDCIVASTFLMATALRERLEGRGQRKSNILPMDDD